MADRVADGVLHFDWAVVTRNRPLTFALAFTLAIVSALALAFNAKSESNSLDVFKPDSEMYRAFTLVDDELGGSGVVSMIFASNMQDYYRQIDPFNEVARLRRSWLNWRRSCVDSYTSQSGKSTAPWSMTARNIRKPMSNWHKRYCFEWSAALKAVMCWPIRLISVLTPNIWRPRPISVPPARSTGRRNGRAARRLTRKPFQK